MASSKKTWSIAAVMVAVVAVVGYFASSYPPSSEEAAGTIAPAERYRADQIGSEDVKLGDESLQAFMQTDTFDRLINDQAFLDAMNDAAVRDVRTEFRRRLLERFLDGTDDALQGFLQCFEYFVGVQGETTWHTLGEVAALYEGASQQVELELAAPGVTIEADPVRTPASDPFAGEVRPNRTTIALVGAVTTWLRSRDRMLTVGSHRLPAQLILEAGMAAEDSPASTPNRQVASDGMVLSRPSGSYLPLMPANTLRVSPPRSRVSCSSLSAPSTCSALTMRTTRRSSLAKSSKLMVGEIGSDASGDFVSAGRAVTAAASPAQFTMPAKVGWPLIWKLFATG